MLLQEPRYCTTTVESFCTQ